MQFRPMRLASRTRSQCVTGCGARHRRSPTGGAAYGIPLNAIAPLAESMRPSSVPASIVTRGLAGDGAPAVVAQAAKETAIRPLRAALIAAPSVLVVMRRT